MELFRKFPHTNLKPCGGASADCSLVTEKDAEKFNWLQRAFWLHDVKLGKAKLKEIQAKKLLEEVKAERKTADKDLAKDLRNGDSKTLTFKEKFYWAKAKLIFR